LEAETQIRLPRLIADLYQIVDELESRFQRKFTPDGHLVGSIGEVVAAYLYNLKLADQSTESVDAWTKEADPRSVQIKLTAGHSVSLSDSEKTSDVLIVLRLQRGTGFEEIFNGCYPATTLNAVKSTKRRVKTVSLRRLREVQKTTIRCLEDRGRIQDLNSRFIPGAL
jgi:hypothetical protein